MATADMDVVMKTVTAQAQLERANQLAAHAQKLKNENKDLEEENNHLRQALRHARLTLLWLFMIGLVGAFGLTFDWVVSSHELAVRQQNCNIIDVSYENENIWYCNDGLIHLLGEKAE